MRKMFFDRFLVLDAVRCNSLQTNVARYVFWAAALCLVINQFAFAAPSGPPDSFLSLNADWRIQSSASARESGEAISAAGFETKEWIPATIPTTVLAALVENKIYPDPFYSDNLEKIPGYKKDLWLVMPEDSPFRPSWWHRVEFDIPKAFEGKNLVLHLDGINYRANVWLNGKRIAEDNSTVGMFRRFEFDVTSLATVGGRNCLALEITAPGHVPEKNYGAKQIEATTGWDDHNPQPPDLNMGIWRDVYITATGPVALRNVFAAPKLDLPNLDAAHVSVSADLVNKTDNPVSGVLLGKIEEIVFEQKIDLAPREHKTAAFAPDAFAQLNITHPRVWWPNGLGTPELYGLEMTFQIDGAVSDSVKTRFGIRDATTYINDEGWRGYKINGKNILIRGGAWMTCDMLLRLSKERYAALVRYAKEAHLNMLRSEGFSIRETDDFYDLCDEMGIMVTQQLFGRNLPDEALAISCVEDTLLRIRNHPSLVHFLGHDETFPTKTLDAAYRDMIERLAPGRTYQPHSGAFEIKERFKTGGTRTGSLQVWTYATPQHYYVSKETSAWGFAQSGGVGGMFAVPETMRRFLPENALWPVWTDAWSLHTVTQGGKYFTAVVNAVNNRYGESAGFDEFIRKGLALNYESARGMFEAYARNKYSATGITTWKFDAAWPASPTWQYIDWFLNPTAGYFAAQKACEPLHVLYAYDDHCVYVANGLYKDFSDLTASAELFDFDMKSKWSKEKRLDVGSDETVKAFEIKCPKKISKCYFLLLTLKNNQGEIVSDNFYWLSTTPDTPNKFEHIFDEAFLKPSSVADYKELNSLPPVKLDIRSEFSVENGERVAKVTLSNPTSNLAFFTRLMLTEGEGGPVIAPAFWNENCVSLTPGASKTLTVHFAAQRPGEPDAIVKADGWNLAR
jgi:exo-1,4-beta-D-glucosaminidase